jgi:hypothetical protein
MWSKTICLNKIFKQKINEENILRACKKCIDFLSAKFFTKNTYISENRVF